MIGLGGQGSLAEALMSRSSRAGAGRLDRIAGLIDWGAISAILSELHRGRIGRPSYPPDVMMRALLLAQWYRLSDPELEEALADRMSFRRFVGLSLQDQGRTRPRCTGFAAPSWPTAWLSA